MPLVALHNLDHDKLARVHAAGGLARPSLAVLPLGNRFGPYGGITLVAPPSMADPAADARVVLFDRDFHSATYPAHMRDGACVPVAEAVVAMAEEARTHRLGTVSPNKVYAAFASAFRSLDEATDAADRVAPRNEHDDELRMAVDEAFGAVMALGDHLRPRDGEPSWDRSLRTFDAVHLALIRSVSHDGSLAALEADLVAEGFRSPPPEGVRAASRVREAVLRVRPAYFEAKVGRAVALDEFLAAAVPHDADPSVHDLLRSAGIHDVGTYDGPEDRTLVTSTLAEVVGAVHDRAGAPSP